ncbi:hypothetical protein Tco_1007803 [Tanacetum coccineum]
MTLLDSRLTDKEKLQANCELKATNIVLHGLPPDVYALVNHHKISKDIRDRIKLLILPPEWGKFVTDVNLARDLHTSNYDQLYAYIEQHKVHANEARLMREIFPDPLAIVANYHPQIRNPYGAPHHPQQFPTTYPTNLSHTQPFVPQNAYPPPTIPQQPHVEFPQLDSGLEVSTFVLGDDLIACMNKAMEFLSAVFTPRYPSTNNQLISSSNPRNQATVQDGRVTVQQVQRRQGQNVVGSGSQGNASGSRGNTSSQEKAEGKELDEEQLAFIADPGVADGQVAQTITYNASFQTNDLDAYDFDCDDISSTKAVLIANLLSCDSDILSELEETQQDKANNESKIVNESLTAELERYKERAKILEQRFNVDLSSHEKFIDSQIDDMIRMKNAKFAAFETEIDTLKQTLSKHVKEKESLLTTLNGFKTEFKERESKSINKEIVLENKNKELENTVCKLYQSTQAMHIAKFWLQSSDKNSEEPSTSNTPVKIEVPSELLKFDKGLHDEITEVQTVFTQMEAAVEQCSVDRKCCEIQQKQFLIENDRLLDKIISQEIMNIVLNSSIFMCDSVKKNDDVVDICNKCLELEAEFVKKNNAYNELSKRFLHLEQHCISLKVDMQLNQEIFQKDKSSDNQNDPVIQEYFKQNDLKAQLQAKDTVINKLKETIHSLRENANPAKVKQVIDEIEIINIELEHNLKAQIQEKVFANAALKNELRKLKGKTVIDSVVSKPHATTIAPGMFKLNLEPLAPKVLKNKDAHLDYIKHSREHADTLWEIIKSARALSPLDSNLDSACKYVQRIQEVLVHVKDTCPCLTRPSEKLVVVTPMNKDKKIRFADPVTSSRNTQKQADSQKPKDSNQPLLHSI